MASELPYLPSYKNVAKLFKGIEQAKQPPAFTHKFLQETIGLKGTADRALIPLMRTLGFIDASNKPTSSYSLLKNSKTSKKCLAEAIRKAFEPLFTANEKANDLSMEDLKGLVAQIGRAHV